MSIFIITAGNYSERESVSSAISKAFPEQYMQIGDCAWLVDGKEITNAIDISGRLGVLEQTHAGDIGTYIVNVFNGYYGYHNNDVWQWLRARGL